MRTNLNETFPVFSYQGVFVLGDVSLQDYNDATGVVRRELRVGEEIIEVIASMTAMNDSRKSALASISTGR
jgi:hypothetical protein